MLLVREAVLRVRGSVDSQVLLELVTELHIVCEVLGCPQIIQEEEGAF